MSVGFPCLLRLGQCEIAFVLCNFPQTSIGFSLLVERLSKLDDLLFGSLSSSASDDPDLRAVAIRISAAVRRTAMNGGSRCSKSRVETDAASIRSIEKLLIAHSGHHWATLKCGEEVLVDA